MISVVPFPSDAFGRRAIKTARIDRAHSRVAGKIAYFPKVALIGIVDDGLESRLGTGRIGSGAIGEVNLGARRLHLDLDLVARCHAMIDVGDALVSSREARIAERTV